MRGQRLNVLINYYHISFTNSRFQYYFQNLFKYHLLRPQKKSILYNLSLVEALLKARILKFYQIAQTLRGFFNKITVSIFLNFQRASLHKDYVNNIYLL